MITTEIVTFSCAPGSTIRPLFREILQQLDYSADETSYPVWKAACGVLFQYEDDGRKLYDGCNLQ